MTEARTDMANETPILALSDCECQCSEAGPRPLRGRKPGDDYLLALRRLDLQPTICPSSRQVLAIGTLGHDTFEAITLGLVEKFLAEGWAVTAKCDQFVLRQ